MKLMRQVLLTIAFGGLVAAGSVAPSDPAPDLTGVEPQVAEKIEALRRDAVAHPESAAAWGLLAMNLHVHEFKSEALGHYERAAALDPQDFRWPYYRAMCLVDLGLPGAPEGFETALALEPRDAPLLVRYGEVLANAGRLEEAEKRLSAAIGAEPPIAAHAYLGLAQVALARDDAETALYYARRAVELVPGLGEAHGLMAELHRRGGNREQAAREMSLARRLPGKTNLPDPAFDLLVAEGVSSYWHLQRGHAYLRSRRYDRAAAELEKAVEAAPSAEHHDLLGLALYYLGRRDEALEHYRAALKHQPDYPAALLHMGVVLFDDGELEEAITAAERALEQQPDLVDGELNLGRFYHRAERRGEAIAAFRRALDQAPGDPRPTWPLAWLLATSPEDELRDGEEARRLADQASRATRFRSPEALDALAAAYAEIGQFDRAVRTARQAHGVALRARRGELAGQIEERAKLYEAGAPYREELP